MLASPVARIRLISFLFVLVAFVLLARLFFVQVVDGESYSDKATEQYANTTQNLYNRGSIFFKRKDGELLSGAALKSGYKLAINPKEITDKEKLFGELSQYITLDKEVFLEKAGKKDDPYEELTDRLDSSVADKIKELGLSKEISLVPNRWRFYPGGILASHIVGFVGFNNEDYSGRYGLERYYNNILERNSEGLYNNFFAQIFQGAKSLISKNEIREEGDLVLTIEPVVQGFIENELGKLFNERQTDEAGIIVMDPMSGEIVSMGALPSFNPQTYFTEEDIGVFSNPLIENIYEMGSIVKPLTIAAALDAGVLSEGDTYNDKGFVELNGERIENFDQKGRGMVSIQEILNQSLNTGAVHAMQKLGRGKFREYMLKFGFGEKTLIDLPDEVAGRVINLESRQDIEYATASFGQGIAMSPINMTRALASLSNGGVLVRPHLVKEFKYDGFPSRVVYTEEQEKVLSKETSERISRMLVKVVDEALVGGKAKLLQHTIAAKTGTAQISNPTGGYYEDRFLHSFFGYFPAYEPRFLIFIYIVNPKTGRYSSETLTDPFMNITKFLLNYYEIPPDR